MVPIFRKICTEYIEENPQVISGTVENCEPLVFEIDEAIFHRKCNKGKYKVGTWVWGIKRTSGGCFLTVVPNGYQETLIEIILKFILPGSLIITDGQAAYSGIETLRERIYSH